MRAFFFLATAAAFLLSPDTAEAQYRNSLWTRRRPSHTFLFHDTHARRQGDVITIVVTENSIITNRDQRNLKKDNSAGAKGSLTTSTGGDLGVSAANGNLDYSNEANRDFNGSSRFSSTRGIQDRVTARVQAVMPNGNLWVVGTRRVNIEGDERCLYISGIVRPLDVRPDNTIPSTMVSDLRIRSVGKGAETRFTRQSWFSRGANKLWPF